MAEGLPTDLAHDVFEGFAIDFMPGIIGVLVEQKCFTLQQQKFFLYLTTELVLLNMHVLIRQTNCNL